MLRHLLLLFHHFSLSPPAMIQQRSPPLFAAFLLFGIAMALFCASFAISVLSHDKLMVDVLFGFVLAIVCAIACTLSHENHEAKGL